MSQPETDRRDMSLLAKLSRSEPAEPPWSLIGALLTAPVMLVCLTLIGPALASTLSGSIDLTPATLMLSWAFGFALTIAFVIVSRRSSDESWRALALRRGELPLPMALFLGVALALALDLAVSLASGAFLPLPVIWGIQASDLSGALLAALIAAVLQPLAETLVFQGVLLPRLRWQFGAWRGLILTALIYTALHQLVFMAAYSHYHPLWHGVILPLGLAVVFSLLKVYMCSTGAVLLGRMGAGLVFLLTALAIYGG